MGRLRVVAWAMGMVLCLGIAARAQEAKEAKGEFDKDFPPRAVKSEPADREKDVDYRLSEIKVTFDRPMATEKAWSWMNLTDIGVYPGLRGSVVPPVRWEDDGRTCVLPVKLSPDTLYAVGCNSPRNTGFRGRDGKVAVPHVWVFRTKK